MNSDARGMAVSESFSIIDHAQAGFGSSAATAVVCIMLHACSGLQCPRLVQSTPGFLLGSLLAQERLQLRHGVLLFLRLATC